MDLENAEFIEVDVPEQDRPRTLRRLGLKPPLDAAFDNRVPVSGAGVGLYFGKLCRIYRRLRPRVIGDRCAFEPSCSRYCEYCLETYPLHQALQLSFARLRLCSGKTGGVHLPPDNFKGVSENG